MSGARTCLLLADYHALRPFIVRSHQYLSRAAAFQKGLGKEVDVRLFLSGPEVSVEAMEEQCGMEVGEELVRFGPSRISRLLGVKLTRTGRFVRAVEREVLRLSERGEVVVYLRTLKLAYLLLPFLEREGISFVFETHEVFHLSHPGAEMERMEREVYARAAVVIPISVPLGEDVEKIFGVEPGPVLASGHSGVNFGLPDYVGGAEARFLYIGSLHRWKGLEPFLLATKKFQVPTDVVGDAGGLERMKEFCQEYELEHVVFHGQQAPEELAKFYHSGAICVLPLSEEKIAQRYTSPLKLFEYAAAGRPVLVGDTPTIRTIPGVEEVACLVGEGGWETAVGELLGDEAARVKMAAAGRRFARGFTWAALAEGLGEDVDFRALLKLPSQF